MQDGNHDAFGIAQRDRAAAGLEVFREGFGNIQGDRHRPEKAVAQPHFLTDAFVIVPVHESGEGRKAAVEEQFEIANLAWSKVPRREVARLGLGFGRVFGFKDEVNEFASVRRDEMAMCR